MGINSNGRRAADPLPDGTIPPAPEKPKPAKAPVPRVTELTPELIEEFAELVDMGSRIEIVGPRRGVNRYLFEKWLERGWKDLQAEAKAFEQGLPMPELSIYAQLVARIDAAEKNSEGRLTATCRRHAHTNFNAVKFLLTSRYGWRVNQELTINGGVPVEIVPKFGEAAARQENPAKDPDLEDDGDE
jgi:hypothetical protein